MTNKGVLGALALSCAVSGAEAAEFKVGEPVAQHGMDLQILYIQAVTMSAMPEDMVNAAESKPGKSDNAGHGGHGDHGAADIHLEASVTAQANNAWGFKEGHWVPYLNIHYSVFKNGSFFRASGRLIPMASNGGPHYGANIKLDGPGKYFVTYRVEPPKATEFPYHTDKETGVNGWWPSFEMKDSFTYLGVGKKGGY